jgi:hypothetical protein
MITEVSATGENGENGGLQQEKGRKGEGQTGEQEIRRKAWGLGALVRVCARLPHVIFS